MAEKKPVRRRTRIRRGPSVVVPAADKAKLTKQVNEYFDLEAQVAEMTLRMSSLSEETFDTMKKAGIKEWPVHDGQAEIVIPMGNSSTSIDVEAFRESVPDEDFMASISVSVTNAKKVLSGKELDAIAEVTPGKKKPAVIAFVNNDKLAKRKKKK